MYRTASHVDIENVYNTSIFIIQLKIRASIEYSIRSGILKMWCAIAEFHGALHWIPSAEEKSQDYKHLERLYFLMLQRDKPTKKRSHENGEKSLAISGNEFVRVKFNGSDNLALIIPFEF